MNSSKQIPNLLIKSLTNPFHRFKPIEFKQVLKNAKNVLIYCPYSYTILSDEKTKDAFDQFFERTRVKIIDPNPDRNIKNDSKNLFFTYLNLDPNHFVKAIRSEKLQSILKIQYDFYLDLSSQLSILNTYVGYKVNAPLKIGSNADNPNIFNLNYQIKSTPDKQDRLLSIIKFLNTFSA